METVYELDRAGLSALQPQISQALADVSVQVEAWLFNAATAEQVAVSRKRLHESGGALQMLGQYGPARVGEEIGSLLDALLAGKLTLTQPLASTLRAACQALTRYLDGLRRGEPDVALRLFATYRALRRAQGHNAAESDLFFPSLNVQLSADSPPSLAKPSGVNSDLSAQRSRYQAALLTWLRDPSARQGLDAMREAVAAFASNFPTGSGAAFWQSALAFLDAVVSDAVPVSIELRRIFSRIDFQMKRASENLGDHDTSVLRDILYCVARAQPKTGTITRIQKAFALESYLPSQAEEDARDLDDAVLPALRQQLGAAKNAWNEFGEGAPQALDTFSKAIAEAGRSADRLRNPVLAGLLLEFGRYASSRQTSPADHGRMAEEMAALLLWLEASLQNDAHRSERFIELTEKITDSLKSGAELSAATSMLTQIGGTDAQQTDLMAGAVEQVAQSLTSVKQAVEAFALDASTRADLRVSLPTLARISGVLSMLDLTGAVKLTDLAAKLLTSIVFADSTVNDVDNVEKVADAIGSCEYYLETAPLDRSRAEQVMLKALRRLGADEPELGVGAPQDASVSPTKVIVDFAIGGDQPAHLPVVTAQVLDLDLFSHSENASAASELPSVNALINSSAPPSSEIVAPAAVVDARQRFRVIDAEALDPDMLEVFLEEAQEVLAGVTKSLARLKSEPNHRQTLTDVRRAFHTLKGSGRMVGLKDLGEVAWTVEQALNQELEENRPASTDLCALIEKSREDFETWVDELQRHGRVTIDPQAIATLAQNAQMAPPQRPPAIDGNVTIGAATITQTLFRIFIDEARSHMASLEREMAALRAATSIAPGAEFLRAAHTLAGIARNTGFPGLADLAYVLERWCQYSQQHPRATSAAEINSIAKAIAALQDMVIAIGARQPPQSRREQVAEIDALIRVDRVQIVERTAAAEPHQRTLVMAPVAFDQATDPDADAESYERTLVVAPALATPISAETEYERTQVLEPAAASDVDRAAATNTLDSTTLPTGASASDRRRVEDDVDLDLLPVFLEEAEDLRAQISADTREWRKSPADQQLRRRLQRTLHTLKGSSRVAGLMRIGELVHRIESRVEAVQEFTPAFFDDLDEVVDRIAADLGRMEAKVTGGRGSLQLTATSLAATFARTLSGDMLARTVAPHAITISKTLGGMPASAAAEPAEAPAEEYAAKSQQYLRVSMDAVNKLADDAAEINIARARMETELGTSKQSIGELTDNIDRLRKQLREMEIQAESQIQSRMVQVQDEDETFDPLEFDRFTRIQELTRFMAESVHDVATVQHTLLQKIDDTEAVLRRQAFTGRDLQDGLMRLRMAPLASIADRLYRTVRQTAKALDKKAQLEIDGGEVGLDRGVMERMIASFEHILRNAIAHGLEAPQQRVSAGKQEIGTIKLIARQRGNQVHFLVRDDGAGLDIKRVRAKAIEQGLLPVNSVAPDAQIMQIIFAPGFTTAGEVTEVSGRGVGLDVVKNEITSLGGTVEVSSEPGVGVTFEIYLPVTLALTRAVLVRAAGKLYAIPAAMVEQVQRRSSDEIAAMYRRPTLEWQNQRYEFHYLPRLMGEQAPRPENERFGLILLVRSGAERMALHVDGLQGNREIVIKPLGAQLAKQPWIVGATILGNGQVVLIIDPVRIGRSARQSVTTSSPKQKSRALVVMVVDDSLTVRKITGRFLGREGFQVLTAKDGLDALEQLETNLPDLMLVDIEMPRMDGFELTKRLRANARTVSLPIIMITSRTAEKHKNYAKQVGVDVYLGKPYEEEELLQQIRALVAPVGNASARAA